ncbi:MAG: YceD family protein [Microbacterium sp.]|uniref:YceD family protein n=1 Tax=Microbacterium sp. TaxID=51671 RepID=UPI003A87830F
MREVTFDAAAPVTWGEGLVAVREGENVAIDARLESVHEGILVTAEADTAYDGVCGRCLTDIRQPLRVEFQELFAYSGREAADLEVHDDHVDLETEVRDAIVLSLPFQPVCRPDCPGLDPSTGQRRDDDTGADPQHDLDPRWARLAELTKRADADDASQTPTQT